MRPLRAAIALVTILAAAPAGAVDEYPRDDDAGSPAAGIKAWIDDARVTFRINSSPILRTIVCRVPFTDFTLESLAKATGIPKDRLAAGVNELVLMGLVRWRRGEQNWIQPASEDARKKMLKSADDWCGSNESCEVGK